MYDADQVEQIKSFEINREKDMNKMYDETM